MAEGSFKIAGAFVAVHLKDETEADERRIRARLEKSGPVTLDAALKDPDNLRLVKDRIEASAPAKIRTDADTKLAQAKIAELAASRNAAVVTIDADIAKAESRIEGLEAKRGKTKIDVDAEVGKARAKIEALQAKKTRILVEADVDDSSIKKAGEKVESETAKMAKRANAQFSALQFAVAFAGLPAAAAVAGAGTVAALGVVPVAFTAIAAASLKTNAEVAGSWVGLGHKLRDNAVGWSAPFVGEFTQSANEISRTVDNLDPQIRQAFANSTGSVDILTDSVTGLATNAMPGLVVATANAEKPLLGLESLAVQTGAGFTDLWRNLSQGAQSSQGVLETTGGVIRDLLGFTGGLFANLTNNGGPALSMFRTDLQQVEDITLSLTSSTSPLIGAISGFLSTVSGGLTAVSGLAAVMNSLPGGVDHVAGSLFAAHRIAGLFGTSLTNTGFGLKAFSSSVDDAGNRTTPFAAAVKDADTMGGRFTAGLKSIVSTGFNPLGLALVGGGLLLDHLGQKQQEAAQKANDHREAVRALTQALQEDNGAIGQNVKAVNAKAFADKNVENNAKAAGLGIGLYTQAAEGNANALATVTTNTNSVLYATLKQAGASDTQIKGIQGYNRALLENGGTAADYKTQLDNLSRTYQEGTVNVTHLSASQRAQVDAILNANGALGEQIRAQKDAHAQYILTESALTGLNAAQIENRDATQKATEALYASRDAHLGYRAAVQGTQQAQDAYNDAMSKGKEPEKAAALLALEQAWARQTQAAYNAAFADSTATTEAGKVAAAQRAANTETVNLANAFSGPLPASLQQTISQFDLTSARAAGLRTGVNDLGQAVYILPSGKMILLDTTAPGARPAVQGLAMDINSLRDRRVTIETVHVNSYYDAYRPTPGGGTSRQVGETGRAMGALDMPGIGMANGGFPTPTRSNALNSGLAQFVSPGMLRWIGDAKVPELFAPLNGSTRTADLISTAAQHEGLVSSAEVRPVQPSQAAPVTVQVDASTVADVVATAVARAVPAAVAAAVEGVFADGLRIAMDANTLETGLIRMDRRRRAR